MDWFLSGNGLCHERVKKKTFLKLFRMFGKIQKILRKPCYITITMIDVIIYNYIIVL